MNRIGNNDKYEIYLKDLTLAQKEHAYRVMGLYLLDYSNKHVVDLDKLQRLLTLQYVKDYKKINILY